MNPRKLPLPAEEGSTEGRSLLVTHARELREWLTRPERLLWRRLRSRQLLGAKFRRQHPVGPFIVDFVAIEERLVIELDGGQHAAAAAKRRDAERSAVIERCGFRVLRFWNGDVLQKLDAVVEVIAREIEERRKA